MINTNFEVYKLKRELKRSGKSFEFKRRELNEFNERNGELVEVTTILGLYHEQNSNIQLMIPEGAITRTKKIPMILCLTDEEISKLEVGDETTINNMTYKVTGIIDIMLWGKISDISLEVVDDGRNPV